MKTTEWIMIWNLHNHIRIILNYEFNDLGKLTNCTLNFHIMAHKMHLKLNNISTFRNALSY